MLVHLPGILTPDTALALYDRLQATGWGDGKATAGFQSGRVKENLQIGPDTAEGRALGAIVLDALEASPAFMSAALPRQVFPPLFNRYDPGMHFGMHVDNAVRQVPLTGQRLRTDLSATLFLSDPDRYDGGDLVIEDTYGTHRVKLPAGDMVLYPSRSLHRVEPVTRGSRIASFFWMQSMVKSRDHREMLYDLDRAVQDLGAVSGANDPAIVRLTGLYHNLLREWGEL
jgi:PKHD-type hydroxylase